MVSRSWRIQSKKSFTGQLSKMWLKCTARAGHEHRAKELDVSASCSSLFPKLCAFYLIRPWARDNDVALTRKVQEIHLKWRAKGLVILVFASLPCYGFPIVLRTVSNVSSFVLSRNILCIFLKRPKSLIMIIGSWRLYCHLKLKQTKSLMYALIFSCIEHNFVMRLA